MILKWVSNNLTQESGGASLPPAQQRSRWSQSKSSTENQWEPVRTNELRSKPVRTSELGPKPARFHWPLWLHLELWLQSAGSLALNLMQAKDDSDLTFLPSLAKGLQAFTVGISCQLTQTYNHLGRGINWRITLIRLTCGHMHEEFSFLFVFFYSILVLVFSRQYFFV